MKRKKKRRGRGIREKGKEDVGGDRNEDEEGQVEVEKGEENKKDQAEDGEKSEKKM